MLLKREHAMKDSAKFKVNQSNQKFCKSLNYIYADSHFFFNDREIRVCACVCVCVCVCACGFARVFYLCQCLCIHESEKEVILLNT